MMGGVVKIASEHKGEVSLHAKEIRKVLKDSGMQRTPICVISLCGEYGTSKSFLAKIFLQYLKHQSKTRNQKSQEVEEWLEAIGNDSVGEDEVGIYMYRDIFKVYDVAIVILQVQGGFSVNREATLQVFALACMLSSIQILNVRNQLRGIDISFLQDYVEFATRVGPEVKMTGKWDLELCVLIRDWAHSRNKAFGFEGGKKYYDEALDSNKFHDTEKTFMKTFLEQRVGSLKCFLMPHPGPGVVDKDEVDFDDLGMRFTEALEKLAVELFSTLSKFGEKKIVKKSNSSAEYFIMHVEKCLKAIKKGKANPGNVKQAPIPTKRTNPSSKTKRVYPRKNYLKPDPISDHRAVKIIDIEDDEVTLHAEEFERILGQKEIGDKPVALISVAGTFRKGKSFILNFFLRYMRNKGYLTDTGDEWMGDRNKPIADGFEWSSGIEPHTNGIMLYSEPFILNTVQGEVAVLFMDTQGLFDSNTSEEKNLRIFAFNTLISSVQILNMSMNFDENDFNFLQFFTAYARNVAEKEANGQFLQNLLFLIRDWQKPREYEYGRKGGKLYLDHYMQTKGKHPDLKAVREYIASSYQNIGCFLMPHPGLKLTQEKDFGEATLVDLEGSFVKQLTPLASSILQPDKLEVKRFNDGPITARQLYATATKCIEAFNKEDFKMEISRILEVITDARMNEIRLDLLRRYNEKMKGMYDSCLSIDNLKAKHEEAVKAALKKEYTVRSVKDLAKMDACKKHAKYEMQNGFAKFVAKQDYTKAKANFDNSTKVQEALTSYKRQMNALKERPVPPEEFDDIHHKYWDEVMKVLTDWSNYVTLTKDQLEVEKQKLYEVYKRENERNHEITIKQLEMPEQCFEIEPNENAGDQTHDETNKVSNYDDATVSSSVKDIVTRYQDKYKKREQSRGELSKQKLKTSDSVLEELKGHRTSGIFRYHINLLEKAVSKVEQPTKIQPDKGRLENIWLRRYVNESLQGFDMESRQLQGLYVPDMLNRAVEKFEQNALEIFDKKVKAIQNGEAVARHRQDLAENLRAKKNLLQKENARNKVHYTLGKEQIEAAAIKRYHNRMNQVLATGYIPEGKLKKVHEDVRYDVMSEMDLEMLPIYLPDGTRKSEEPDIKNMQVNLQRKMDSVLYQQKKDWNKRNHGVVVRALANFLY